MDTDVGPPGKPTAQEMMLSGMLHKALLDAAGWAGVNQSLRDQRDAALKKLDEAEQELQGLRDALTSCQEHADAAWHEYDLVVQKLEDAGTAKCEHGLPCVLCSAHRGPEDWLRSHVRAIGYGFLLGSSEQEGPKQPT